jgi:RimJ/RimL family protein N-acetyltransferase
MVATLARRAATIARPVRTPTPDDLPLLAESLFDAYLGTIDFAGDETPADAVAELESYLAGGSGEPLLDCSFVALDDSDFPVSACLISFYEGLPLIAYSFTTSDWKGRGLATGLLKLAMNALAARGHQQVALYVTRGNQPAEYIYEKLGFRDA